MDLQEVDSTVLIFPLARIRAEDVQEENISASEVVKGIQVFS